MRLWRCVTLCGCAPSAFAHSIITVEVGNNNVRYNPNSIVAEAGSVIVFKFMSEHHSVGKAAFGTPCQPFDYVEPGKPSFYSGPFNGKDLAEHVSLPWRYLKGTNLTQASHKPGL